jgi:hypothetical protein
MQQIKPNQDPNFTKSLEHSGPSIMQDKSNIYRHEVTEKHLSVPLPAPIRVHQNFVQRQQYYTGDA